MTPLRVGILGTGYMGRLHARNLRTFPDVALTACCARTQEQAADFSREETAGQAVAYADFSHMLHESPLDALYICLPPFAHTGQTEQAAAAGLHLFLEKPLALTEAHAATMVAAIERAGVVSQVGYHQRFGAAVERARAMIVDGMAGRPTLFQASYECNALHSAWWRDQTRSGGQVFEQVIHQYDLAHFFLGPAQLVTGFVDNLCHRQYADYTVDDTSVAAIRFTSGAMASIIGSNCAVPMEWRSAFHLICERLTVHFTSPNDA